MNFKLTLLTVLLAFSTITFAQIEGQKQEDVKTILGPKKGDWRIGLSASTYSYHSNIQENIGLDVEYFMKDNLSLHSRIGGSSRTYESLNHEGTFFNVNLETGLRYYYHKSKRWNFWTDATLGTQWMYGKREYPNFTSINRRNSLYLNVGIGAEYKFNDKFSLSFSSNFLGSAYNSTGYQRGVSLGFAPQLNLGFKIKL